MEKFVYEGRTIASGYLSIFISRVSSYIVAPGCIKCVSSGRGFLGDFCGCYPGATRLFLCLDNIGARLDRSLSLSFVEGGICVSTHRVKGKRGRRTVERLGDTLSIIGGASFCGVRQIKEGLFMTCGGLGL